MKKALHILFMLLIYSGLSAQQDPQISHYFFTKTLYNPAYAGFEDQVCINFLTRNQWIKFEGAPQTNVLTVDAPIRPFGSDAGVGINIVDDKYGFVRDFRFSTALSYNIDMPIGSIRIGLSPGILSKKFDASWKFPDQEENILDDKQNVIIFDIGGGIYYSLNNLFIGISSKHLLKPKMNFESESGSKSSIFLARHYYFSGGYTFSLANSSIELTPSVLLKSDGNVIQSEINIFALYNKKFWTSVTYRNKDALAFFVGTSYFKDIRVGFSYDITLSYINKVSNGTIEAYLGYNFSFIKPANAQKYKNVKTL